MTSTSVNPAAESRPQISSRPPRMPGIPFLTDNLNMLNDPLRYLVRGYQKLGPVFRVRMGTIEYTILAGLEANLFLQGDRWLAGYVPAVMSRGPFLIGQQEHGPRQGDHE